MIVKNKKLMVGLDHTMTVEQALTVKRQLDTQFPNHEVVVVAGLQYVEEVTS